MSALHLALEHYCSLFQYLHTISGSKGWVYCKNKDRYHKTDWFLYTNDWDAVESYIAKSCPLYEDASVWKLLNPQHSASFTKCEPYPTSVYLLELLESESRSSSSLSSSRKRRPYLFFFGLCHGLLRLSLNPPIFSSKSYASAGRALLRFLVSLTEPSSSSSEDIQIWRR